MPLQMKTSILKEKNYVYILDNALPFSVLSPFPLDFYSEGKNLLSLEDSYN